MSPTPITSTATDRWLDHAAVGLCAAWVFILISSAIIDRYVLWLHLFQSTIYAAAIALIAVLLWRWSRRGDRSALDLVGLLVALVGTYLYFGLLLFVFGRPFLGRYLRLFVP